MNMNDTLNSDFSYLYRSCTLCPRNCRVNRLEGESGYCGETSQMRIAWAGLHKGEEPPVSGVHGSGAVFFTGCTMKCIFCQNSQLSSGILGSPVTPEELAGIFIQLQKEGAANVNLVTATHFIPGILRAFGIASRQGFLLPVVWNSSGYEKTETLEMLGDFIDLWLPDLKTLDPETGRRLFNAEDYPFNAEKAIEWMGLRPTRGIPSGSGLSADRIKVIVRHLSLPGHMQDSREVISWFSCSRKPGMIFSLMTQYLPMPAANGYLPDRKLTREEILALGGILEEFAVDTGFFQDDEDESGSWRPDFSVPEPFPAGFARKIWYWS